MLPLLFTFTSSYGSAKLVEIDQGLTALVKNTQSLFYVPQPKQSLKNIFAKVVCAHN